MDALKNFDLQLSLFSAEIDPKKRDLIFKNQTLSMEDIIVPSKKLILEKQSDPYVRGFVDQLYRMLANTAISWKDRDGTSRALSNIGAGNWITLGSSNQAVAMDDYYVVTAIGHGVSAGQLIYGVVSNSYYGNSGIYTVGSSRICLNMMPAVNMSGGNVTVEEVCLYGGQYPNPWYYYTHARDLTGSITLADGAAIVVEYRHSVTV